MLHISDLLHFNVKSLMDSAFLPKADVLPNMEFSSTRKRLIHSHDCTQKNNFVKNIIQTAAASSNEDVEL